MTGVRPIRGKQATGSDELSLSFLEYLEAKLNDGTLRQKGVRTRQRLKIATVKMLAKVSFHQLRITDVAAGAGVAEGSFYVYFKDKKDVTLTVLREFLKDFIELRAPAGQVQTSFDFIRMANRRWLALCRVNAGLMRCMFELSAQDRDFARLVHKTNRSWCERMSKAPNSRVTTGSARAALLGVYLLTSMMDEIIRKLIVHPDLEFQKSLKAWDASDVAIADAVSLFWLRIFYPEAKLWDDLPDIVKELARMMRA